MKTYGILKFVHDPELIDVGNTVKTNFKLFYNHKRYDNFNNLIKEPHTFDFECWDSAAEFICNNCRKGDEIYIEAIAKQETWTKDGQVRSKTVFRIEKFNIFTR